MQTARVSIIIPVYNEESNLPFLLDKIKATVVDYQYEIIFINDGSIDRSWQIISELAERENNVHGVRFSRNFGHQSALRAGLDMASGDCIVSIDADLQHPPALIPEMINKWLEGYEIVYSQRQDNQRIQFLKRVSSRIFYKIMNALSDVHLDKGSADFRLIDKQVADVIRQTDEINLFIRGYMAWLGYSQYKLEFTPEKRHAGKTKYNFAKMLNFAINGITSFSIKPLRFAVYIGFIAAMAGFLYALYALYIALFTENAIKGWTSILVSVLVLGGIQLIVMGINGEYLGKVFMQTKKRPDYIIKDKTPGL